ncbi:hypothetical protein Tco_0762734 [Tanacetum coccineum]
MLSCGTIIDSSSWSFVSAVLGQMTYLVASLTLDSARTYDEVILIVVVVDDVSLILKLFVVIIGVLAHNHALLSDSLTSGLCWAYAFHQDRASSVRVPVANVTLFSSAQLLRENTDSVRSNQRMRPTAPSVPLK